MSTRSTLFLTDDNEHWYEEGSQPRSRGEKLIGYDIVLEIDKKSIVDKYEDRDDIVITIRGDSDLAKELRALRSMSYKIL